MSYAQGTSVSVGQSQSEIRGILKKYDADGITYGEKIDFAVMQFEMENRRIKFVLPLAVKNVTMDKKGGYMTLNQVEKENRRRWRCLLLCIKSKLECVATGITTLENEFMAHVVLPSGQTVGEAMIPQIAIAYQTNKMPPILGYGG